MIDNNFNKKNINRSGKKKSKLFRPLALSLHTMPRSADSHFKEWLFLALFIFILMVLAALIIFWR